MSAHTIDDFIARRGLDESAIQAEIEALRKREEAYRLAEVRRSQNLTQVQLAEKLGVSQKRVSQVERGDVLDLKLGTLKRYAAGLGGRLKVAIDFPNDQEVALEG